MWFFLGIVSFTGFFAYRLWRKFYWSWGWTNSEGHLRHAGRPYKSQQSENKGTHRFSYAVSCPADFYFRIKRETNWDRWAKRLRLSVEHQFSDPEFDDMLYVASDDPAWHAELAQVPELRNVLKIMFRDPNVRAITCEGRHLRADVQLKAEQVPMQYVSGTEVKNIVAALHGIADCLDGVAKENGIRRRDPYVMRAVLLVSMSSALLLLGVGEFFRLFSIERADVMIDGADLLRYSAAASVVLLAAWLVAAAGWLRGSSHAHLVMGEILISGGLGLLASGYALTRDINCEWDEQAATPYALTVANKQTGYRRKYGTYYKIRFDSAPPGLARTFEVDGKTYALASVGRPLVIAVKPGRLGYRWIESIRQPEDQLPVPARTASPRY